MSKMITCPVYALPKVEIIFSIFRKFVEAPFRFLMLYFQFIMIIGSTCVNSVCRSFYVGDAAGRDRDHSDADVEFAKVCFLLSDLCFIFNY